MSIRRILMCYAAASGQPTPGPEVTQPVAGNPPIILSALVGGQLSFASGTANGMPAPTLALTEVLNAAGTVVASGAGSAVSYTCQASQTLRVRQTFANVHGSVTVTSAAVATTSSGAQTLQAARLLGANTGDPWQADFVYQDVLQVCRGFFPLTGTNETASDLLSDNGAGQIVDGAGNVVTQFGVFVFDNAHPSYSGTYTLRFPGTATVTAPGGGSIVTLGTPVVANGITNIPVSMNIAAVGSHIRLAFSSLSADFRMPALYRPGETGDGLFTQRYKNFIGRFKLIRGMDWTRTNVTIPATGGPGTLLTYDQTYLSSNKRLPNERGRSIQHFATLCNEVGADPWINTPYALDDAGIASAVADSNNYVSSGARISFECLNELWNSSFTEQFQHVLFTAEQNVGRWEGGALPNNYITDVRRVGGVVTVTTNPSNPHRLKVGQKIWTSGFSGLGIGAVNITSTPSANTFTYAAPGADLVGSIALATDTYHKSRKLASASRTAGVVTVTTDPSAPHGLVAGQKIWTSGMSGLGIGIVNVASVVNATAFTYTAPGADIVGSVASEFDTFYSNPDHPWAAAGVPATTRRPKYSLMWPYLADRTRVAYNAAVALLGSHAAAIARFRFIVGVQADGYEQLRHFVEYSQAVYGSDTSWIGAAATAPYTFMDQSQGTSVDAIFALTDATRVNWLRQKVALTAGRAAQYNIPATVYEWGTHWFGVPSETVVNFTAAYQDERIATLQKSQARDIFSILGDVGCYFAVIHASSGIVNFASAYGVLGDANSENGPKHRSVIELLSEPAETVGIDGITHGNINVRDYVATWQTPTKTGNVGINNSNVGGLVVYCPSAGTYRLGMPVSQGTTIRVSADGGGVVTATQAANVNVGAEIPPNLFLPLTLSKGHHRLRIDFDVGVDGTYRFMGPVVSFLPA